ncbi:V-type ATPase subunit [Amycolatopsis benzoatilytica]|uniref:V-type ATPase subunit n=1 Tax=Amycolatopsis benzoatilytica TaxID=346045 RepID=UPI00036C047A|nr:V-type ATPase subunit [Amycolatopsis benzoatilytica]
MKAAWTAGGVRATGLVNRRIGRAGAAEMAASGSLEAALAYLAETPYRPFVSGGQTLAEAEHGLCAAVLWQLRVLAGWLPRSGAEVLRILAGWFEISNLLDRFAALRGAGSQRPYALGALATAWPRLAAASSRDELRAVLATSAWGDPGNAADADLAAALHLSWAGRVAAGSSLARPWAAGGAALLVARSRFLLGRSVPGAAERTVSGLLGPAQQQADSFVAFERSLPGAARWVLHGIEGPAELWRAEEHWWSRVEPDAAAARRRPGFGPEHAVGCAALLALDARRGRAALALAARGRPREVLDALA